MIKIKNAEEKPEINRRATTSLKLTAEANCCLTGTERKEIAEKNCGNSGVHPKFH